MQDDLIEQRYLTFRAKQEPTISSLKEMGIQEAVVTFHSTQNLLRFDSVKDKEGNPRKTICIRDNTAAKLYINEEFYSGTDVCRLCANCISCVTKNTTEDFVLNTV